MYIDFSFSQEKKKECMFMSYQGYGEAKFWLEPEIELAKNYNHSRKQLKKIESHVEEHLDELISAWKQHFSS